MTATTATKYAIVSVIDGHAMVLGYWQRWKERRALAKLDADRLMDEYGDTAYEVAWSMAQEIESGSVIDTRPDGHWDRVRNIIARRTYRPFWSGGEDRRFL